MTYNKKTDWAITDNIMPVDVNKWEQGIDDITTTAILKNGSVALTGELIGVDPSATQALTTKNYVDNLAPAIANTAVSFGTIASGTITLSKDKTHTVTFSGASTIALPTGLTSGIHYNCNILVTMSSVVTITQPTTIWAYGVSPLLTSTSVKYRLTYETVNGGTTWYGYWTQLGA